MMVGHSCSKAKHPQPAPKPKQEQPPKHKVPKLLPTWLPKQTKPQKAQEMQQLVETGPIDKHTLADIIATNDGFTPMPKGKQQVVLALVRRVMFRLYR